MADDELRESVHEDPDPIGDDPIGDDPIGDDPIGDDIAAALVEKFPGSVFAWSKDQPVVYVDAAGWHDIGAWLRDDQQFTQCVDITAVDQLLRAERGLPVGVAADRFEIVANFLSHPRVRRMRVIAQVGGDEPAISTLADLWPGVEYAEREVFDLFGITFAGHPDLTRILMPDDWVGFPLRKDYAAARVPVQFKGAPRPT
jgi:NADH:ubiquinone oxidoreductase subunit C